MKRSGLPPRKTPLRPGGWIRRRTRPARVAKRRVGLSADERKQMDDLARACVMVRIGAAYDIGRDGLRWFGYCEECQPLAIRDLLPDCEPKPLQWSHILGQGESPRTKWLSENAMAHCSGCHWTWTNRVQTAPRAPRLAKILAARCPCAFAENAAAYEARLHGLAAMVGQPMHNDLQRIALIQELQRSAPRVLVDLAMVWAMRAERAARRARP